MTLKAIGFFTLAAALLAMTGPLQAAPPAGGAAKKLFRAGAAVVDITPTRLPVLVNGGMRQRLADKVHDPLHARSLVLDDGRTTLAITLVDNCVIPRDLMDRAKALAHKTTGLALDRMLIAATHAHSCPAVGGVLGCDVQEDYARALPAMIARAIAKAHKNLQPARVGWGVGRDATNVFCRRFLMKPGTARTCRFTGKTGDQAQMNPGHQNPNAAGRTGVADPDVSVVSLQTADGKPLAVLANYSTHYVGAPALSADYFAVFAREIGKLLGADKTNPDFVAILSNGTSGDANCLDFVNPRRKYDRFTVGRDVAQAAFAAWKKIEHQPHAPLAMAERKLTLKIRMPEAKEVAAAREFLKTMTTPTPQTLEQVYARETVLLSQEPPTRELKLQAIRIGAVGIAAMPNEVFGSTGLAIKKASPLGPTFSIELANGYDGYIPPPAQHKLGGYTTWRARSSCLEEQAEPKIRQAVIELLKQVAAEKPPAAN